MKVCVWMFFLLMSGALWEGVWAGVLRSGFVGGGFYEGDLLGSSLSPLQEPYFWETSDALGRSTYWSINREASWMQAHTQQSGVPAWEWFSVQRPFLTKTDVLFDLDEEVRNFKENNPFLRRTEVIFFISLAFSIYYSNGLNSLFVEYTQLILSSMQYRTRRLSLTLLGEPRRRRDPVNLFLWVNSLVWPSIVTANSVFEASRLRLFLFPPALIKNKKDHVRYRTFMHFYQSPL